MAFKPKFNKKRRNYAKRKVKRVYKKKPTFAKKVMSVVNKTSETLMATQVQNITPFNSAISVTGDILRIIPQLSQGDDDNQRKGDEITLTKIDIRGHMIMSTSYTDSASSRIAVRMMIVQPRNLTDWANVIGSTTWLQHLIKRGATSTSFTGTIQDLYSDINTDRIICWYDKIYYLTIPQLLTSVGQHELRSTTKLFRKTLTWKGRKLRYDTIDSGLSPVNFSPVMVLGYVHLDGSSPDTLDTQVSLAFNANIYYKDL